VLIGVAVKERVFSFRSSEVLDDENCGAPHMRLHEGDSRSILGWLQRDAADHACTSSPGGGLKFRGGDVRQVQVSHPPIRKYDS